MEPNIVVKDIFIDKEYFLYVVDEHNILYEFNEGNQYFPFLTKIMTNIKNCFWLNGYYYVHTNNNVLLFNPERYMVRSIDMENMLKNVHQIDYHMEEIVAILDNGVVNIYYGLDYNTQNQQINYQILQKINLPNEKFIMVKISGNTLLAFADHYINVYVIYVWEVQYVTQINLTIWKTFQMVPSDLCQEIFNRIASIDLEKEQLMLQNGNILAFDGNISSTKINLIQKEFFQLDTKSILSRMPFVPVSLTKLTNLQSQFFPFIETIETNEICQCTIVLCDGRVIIVLPNKIVELGINADTINYKTLIQDKSEKEHIMFGIDIDVSYPILRQLVQIIPNIYRSNNEMSFNFNQLTHNGNIISFGIGVTRHFMNAIRKEIDNILENKFQGWEKDARHLGMMLYFCNHEGMEKFFKIHPYFFYLMSNGTADHLFLLKKFKGNDYPLLHKQYIEFKQCPEKLASLGLDLSTVEDFMEYIFSSSLTPAQRNIYLKFHSGYCYFLVRHHLYKLIKHMPVKLFIEMLVGTEQIKAQINFKALPDIEIIFMKIFNTYSIEEQSMFFQNVTGSQYYSSTVYVRFDYKPEPISDDCIDNIFEQKPDRESYSISTCQAQLTIYLEPTEPNIQQILDLLIIEDLTLKN